MSATKNKVEPTSKTQIPLAQLTAIHNGDHFWRRTMCLALLPFVFTGAPIHLLFRRRHFPTDTRQWLKTLFPLSSPFSSLATLLLLVVTVLVDLYTLFSIARILYDLLITGEILIARLYQDLAILYRSLPLVVPLNLLWLRGFGLQTLIASFDNYFVPSGPLVRGQQNSGDIMFTALNNNNDHNIKDMKIYSPKQYRLKFFVLYTLLITFHGLDLATNDDVYRMSENKYSGITMAIKIIGFGQFILQTLCLPSYCTFCWAVRSEMELLFEYVKILLKCQTRPSFEHFHVIKTSCRWIFNQVRFFC